MRYHQNSATVMRCRFNCHKMHGHGQNQKIGQLKRIGPQSPPMTQMTRMTEMTKEMESRT